MQAPVIALPVAGYALRPWQLSDASSLQKHLNNPQVGRYIADWYPTSGYTIQHAQDWVSRGHVEFGGINWAITYEDQAVGSAGFVPNTGFARCNAEIGYWLSEQHWGKGIGTAVAGVSTDQAFLSPVVTRVFAPIHAANAASQRVCEKNGFIREGLQRMSVIKNGQAIDTVVWAAYRDTWQHR